MPDTQIRQFSKEDLWPVYRLIQLTIKTSYREAYPREAIEFFKNYHSKEHILEDARVGYTVVAENKDGFVGTGTLLGINIRRVFISPLLQHQGVGKLIVRDLEKKASQEKLHSINLEASLVSKQFWESLGFLVEREDFIPVFSNQKLAYFRMKKTMSIE